MVTRKILTTVRKPVVTLAMELLVLGEQNYIASTGWGLNKDQMSGIFSGKLPLSYLIEFAEDYKRTIINALYELILAIAAPFKNCYDNTVAGIGSQR